MPEYQPGADALPTPSTVATVVATAPRRGRHRRIALALGLVVVGLAGLVTGVVFTLSENLGNNITRLPDVFEPLEATARPADQPSLTFLLVGTDSRSAEPTTGTAAAADVDEGSARSDVVMMAQIDTERTSASVVSIPRDTWVDIPGRGWDKINAAYAYGGPTLLTHTVEVLTNVRIDHFAVIDFAGFEAMVDAVDGIDVHIANATSNTGVTFTSGLNHLGGAEALAYVRQRHHLAAGDLDRAKRQQNALRALLTRIMSSNTISDPGKLFQFLEAAAQSVDVDDSFSNDALRMIAVQSSELRPSEVVFVTAPVGGIGFEGGRSVIYLDHARAANLWQSLRRGWIADYVARNPGDGLSAAPA